MNMTQHIYSPSHSSRTISVWPCHVNLGLQRCTKDVALDDDLHLTLIPVMLVCVEQVSQHGTTTIGLVRTQWAEVRPPRVITTTHAKV